MNLDLSCVDVVQFLNALGCENVRAEMSEVRFSCPLPAHSYGDKNPSAYMNINTTAWICFSCGAKGNAITFLSEVLGVPHATAKQWIAEKWAPHYADIEDLYEFLLRSFEHGVDEAGSVEQPVIVLPEEVLEGRRVDWRKVDQAGAKAPGALRYMLERGFRPEILARFGVSYDPISDRPCLTVRNEDGELVGFKGRAWNDEQFPKYMIVGDTERGIAMYGQRYGFAPYDASKVVFGMNIAEPINDTLVVCEGELNVIAMHQMGFTNTVGPSGSTLSQKFVDIVAGRCSKVMLLFDSDLGSETSAATAKIKLLTAIEQFDRLVEVFVCPDHVGDPNDMTADDVNKLILGAQNSTLYRVEHLLDERR